jgi:hypothetical protein
VDDGVYEGRNLENPFSVERLAFFNAAWQPEKMKRLLAHSPQDSADHNKILVFPAGVYKVDNSIFIPPGARIVGTLWSQIMATGKAFSDPQNARVLMK